MRKPNRKIWRYWVYNPITLTISSSTEPAERKIIWICKINRYSQLQSECLNHIVKFIINFNRRRWPSKRNPFIFGMQNKQEQCKIKKHRICLFVRGFSSHSRIFHSKETLSLPVMGYKFWPILGIQVYWAVCALNSDGSLTCYTYCDMGFTFIMVIAEDPWHSYFLLSVWQWSCHCLI